MKILILGADGYLGWSMAANLFSSSHDIFLVDNYSKRKHMKILKRYPLLETPLVKKRIQNIKRKGATEFYQLDCSKYVDIHKIIKNIMPDVVIHFAELPSAPFSMMNTTNSWETLRNNLQSTFNIIHSLKDLSPKTHLIKLGTMGEYGTPNIDIEEGWLNIKHKKRSDRFLYPRQGSSLYHTSKIMDTDLIWFYTRMYGLSCTDLMQGPVYGIYPNKKLDDDVAPLFTYDDIFGTVLNRFIIQAIMNQPLTVYGSGNQIRGYINILDSIECIKIAMKNKPKRGELKIYNQFTEQFSVLELAELVKKSLKKININVNIKKVENPRVEKEKHYYNAKHSNLKKLGLKANKLNEKMIIQIANYCMKYKNNIKINTIMPKVKWK